MERMHLYQEEIIMTRNKGMLAIGDLIRKNAYVMEKGKKKYLKVSPSAEKEYISRIIDSIKINAPQIAEITRRDGRKIITVTYTKGKDGVLEPVYDDITQYFGHMDSKATSGTHYYCSKCLKKMEK